MKKVLALIVAASLGGCMTTGTTTTPVGSLSTFIADVQGFTQAACSVIPAANSIAQLISAGDPALSTASAIAGVICSMVGVPTTSKLKRAQLHRIPAPIVIDGVTVHFK